MTYLLTNYTESWQPLIDIVKPIHEVYCQKHGYKYVLKKVPDYGRYTGLDKLNMVLENLTEMDIALVLDADAMITNLNIKVEDFILGSQEFYFSEGLNCGVFIFMATTFSKCIIKSIIKVVESGYYNCEQDALEKEFSGR